MTTRVGVVADTHCPEFLGELPPPVFELLQGVDMILHAGDVTGPNTLAALETIAPVTAVRGDHDRNLSDLPRSRVLEVEGHRVALVHGNRSRLIEEPLTFAGTISLGRFWPTPRLHSHLRRRFPDADAVIYGHTHAASNVRFAGGLMFNPGAVYQVSPEEARRRLARRPNWFEWTWLQVIRHRRRLAPRSVGILEVSRDAIQGRVIPF